MFLRRSCLNRREVEQYLRGRLSNRRRHEIENHLLDCPLCAAAVEGYAAASPGEARESVARLRASISGRNGSSAYRLLPGFNYAAAIVLLLVFSFAGYRYWQATQRNRLFTQYFEPARPGYLSLRSAGAEPLLMPDSPELHQALAYYEAEEYSHSLPHFAAYLEEQPIDWQAHMLAASAALRSGREGMAEQYLTRVQQRGGEYFQPNADWYLALTYLKQGKYLGARALLEKLAPHKEEARILLEKVKEE